MASVRTLADSTKDRLAKFASETEHKKSPTSGERLQHITTRIPERLIVEMKVYCAKNRVKMQDFITEAIQEKLK